MVTQEPNIAKIFRIHQLDLADQVDFKSFCREIDINYNTASLDSLEYLYHLWLNEA